MFDEEREAVVESDSSTELEDVEDGEGLAASFTKRLDEESESVVVAVLGVNVVASWVVESVAAHGAIFEAPASTSSRTFRNAVVA
jgi:hypothetical protein